MTSDPREASGVSERASCRLTRRWQLHRARMADGVFAPANVTKTAGFGEPNGEPTGTDFGLRQAMSARSCPAVPAAVMMAGWLAGGLLTASVVAGSPGAEGGGWRPGGGEGGRVRGRGRGGRARGGGGPGGPLNTQTFV